MSLTIYNKLGTRGNNKYYATVISNAGRSCLSWDCASGWYLLYCTPSFQAHFLSSSRVCVILARLRAKLIGSCRGACENIINPPKMSNTAWQTIMSDGQIS